MTPSVEVPPNLRSLLTKFAWAARGHGFVELDEGRWIPGDASPHPITGFGDWTFSAAVERARALLREMPEKQAFESLVGEIYETSGRRPRLAATVAGKAIWQAQRGGPADALIRRVRSCYSFFASGSGSP